MKEKTYKHKISKVNLGSIAQELDIEAGDYLISINDKRIEDVFDYQYLVQDTFLTILIEKSDGEEWELEIEKDADVDLGLEFKEGLMDEYRSCANKCIFCFIDQMPKGMRPTLYFKDDDSRLSFLQGNYLTMTNLSDEEVDRIVYYKLSPINISIHSTNPELRVKMLGNRFAGRSLNVLDKFYNAGIIMNGQIVLCKGINDGEELNRSIGDLFKYLPYMESLSVVPVGLTKFREGLPHLERYDKNGAISVINMIHEWQKKAMQEHGCHFVHASDEWYIMAEMEVPAEDTYDGYLQLENGVGMLRLLLNEFEDGINNLDKDAVQAELDAEPREISILTGTLNSKNTNMMMSRISDMFNNIKIHVHTIVNDFFGHTITVTGLLTGGDIINQCKNVELGSVLLMSENMLRSGETILLDDVTVADIETSLQVKVHIVESSGYDLIDSVLRGR